MNSIQIEAAAIIHSLGWALLHSMWQGLLIYCLLMALLKLIPSMPASVKYNLAMLSLGLLFAGFIKTVISQWMQLHETAAPGGAAQTIIISRSVTTAGHAANPTGINNFFSGIESYIPIMVNFYIAGLGLLSGRLLYNFYLVKRLQQTATIPAPTEVILKLSEWQLLLNIERTIKLSFSNHVNTAMAIGAMKPVILLPAAMLSQLSTDELEAIIIHELAHIKRHDYLLNIIQTVVETIFFFNPFVWLISTIIRREREHCCDDIVVSSTISTLPYARALATLETYRIYSSSLAMAATGNKNLLFNRIKRIMEMKKKSISHSQLAFTIVVMLGFIVSLVWLNPAIAQSKKDKQKSEAKKETTTPKVNKQHITIIDENGDTRTYTSSKNISPKDKENLKKMDMRFDDEGKLHQNNVTIYSDTITIIRGGNAKNKVRTYTVDKVSQEDGYTREDIKEVQKAMGKAGINRAEINKELRNSRKVIVVTEKHKHDSDKAMAEADRQLADADKQIADADKVIVEANKQLAEADKVLAEADRQLEEFDKKWTDASKEPATELPHPAVVAVKPIKGKAYQISVDGPEYDEMVASMEADGLINRKKGYVIVAEEDKIYIDGRLQPQKVYNKYKKNFEGKKITVKGVEDNVIIQGR